jgi:excisionase family DNA binding protein
MKKEIIQIENISAEEFKAEIIEGVIIALRELIEDLPSNNDEIILSRAETAKLLSISLVTLWDLTRKDKIPAFRIGNRIKYKKSDVLNALIQKNKFNGSK